MNAQEGNDNNLQTNDYNTLRMQQVYEKYPYLKEYHEFTANPPDGWFIFGHHMGQPDVKLEFHGIGLDGLPVWERPEVTKDMDEDNSK